MAASRVHSLGSGRQAWQNRFGGNWLLLRWLVSSSNSGRNGAWRALWPCFFLLQLWQLRGSFALLVFLGELPPPFCSVRSGPWRVCAMHSSEHVGEDLFCACIDVSSCGARVSTRVVGCPASLCNCTADLSQLHCRCTTCTRISPSWRQMQCLHCAGCELLQPPCVCKISCC